MPNPLLPRLRDKNEVTTTGGAAGSWIGRRAGELERISEGLDVTHPKLVSADVDSIPSMWARPLLFQMALYDTRHPIHKRVLGEWRGLLAVLALKEWGEFSITTEQLAITDPKKSPGAKDFLQALQKLLPTDTLDPSTTWETLNILLFNDQPIGITSPTTLVCTAVNCFGRISGVPWFNDRFLNDPVPKLNNYEKEAVVSWVKHVYADTAGLPDGDIKADLRTLLNSFVADLGDAAAVPTFSNSSLGLTQNLYKCLDKPVASRDLPSSVELVPSPNKAPKTTLLVPDPTIPENWEVEPQNVIVWGGKTLATAQSFSGTLKLALPAGVHHRNQQDFFTDKLFVISQEEAFQEHSILDCKGSRNISFNGSPVRPILPITEELLTYLDVRDLNDRMSFDQQNNSIVVSLRLTLSGMNGGNGDFVISKEYSPEDFRVIDVGPALAIWPNFRTPGWKAYYTYFTTADQTTFYAKPFLESGEKFDPQTFSDNRGKVEKEITKTERFPEAMICEYNGTKAGILLISVPEEKQSVGGTDWRVGVDFGTSSTTVYRYGEDDATPQPVAFEDRLFRIIASPAVPKREFYNHFLPPERKPSPFLSLFQKLGNKKTDEPILDGHIYFLENYNALPSAENIVSDLKWSTNATDRENITVFLKQLCLQCAAEAIENGAEEIHWHFSHPLAFTERDRGQFERIWKVVGEVCESETGMSQQVVIPAQSESVVAAKFFANTLQNQYAAGGFASGAVCIDIGGETSDISIWQNNELYWQTSLRFAGRHIFLNLLRENPKFLENLRVDSTDIDLLRKASTGAKDKFYAQADALIQAKGQEWLKELSTVGSESAIQPFVQLISLGIAGLLYYVGLLLNHLPQKTDFKQEIPSIYIGGNGSNILHWMAEGNFNHDTIASRCREHLKGVIRKASGFDRDNNRGIEISKRPKEEAAYGLVTEGTILDESKRNQFNILAGETFTESEIDYSWTEYLTAERFKKRLSVPRNKLERIENFIESFDTGLGAEIQMQVALDEPLSGKTHGATVRDVIFEELEKVFQGFSDAEPDEISVEPLFILALKALLEAKTRRWNNIG